MVAGEGGGHWNVRFRFGLTTRGGDGNATPQAHRFTWLVSRGGVPILLPGRASLLLGESSEETLRIALFE